MRIESVSEADFLNEPLLQDGVYYNLQRIGEASADMIRLYPEYVEANPQIPFSDARGLRNRPAHDYRYIDPQRILATILMYIPELKRSTLDALLMEPLG